jgi:hypothetical protein
MSEPKLSDLDRCLHGRHAVDNCLSCPGGWSAGNPYLVDGQRIGTDLYGRPILVGRVKGPIRRGPDQQPVLEPAAVDPLVIRGADQDEIPGPCQPIGCDHGHHRPGCPYTGVDVNG